MHLLIQFAGIFLARGSVMEDNLFRGQGRTGREVQRARWAVKTPATPKINCLKSHWGFDQLDNEG